MFTDGWYF